MDEFVDYMLKKRHSKLRGTSRSLHSFSMRGCVRSLPQLLRLPQPLLLLLLLVPLTLPLPWPQLHILSPRCRCSGRLGARSFSRATAFARPLHHRVLHSACRVLSISPHMSVVSVRPCLTTAHQSARRTRGHGALGSALEPGRPRVRSRPRGYYTTFPPPSPPPRRVISSSTPPQAPFPSSRS
jgi:hypothetical protein